MHADHLIFPPMRAPFLSAFSGTESVFAGQEVHYCSMSTVTVTNIRANFNKDPGLLKVRPDGSAGPFLQRIRWALFTRCD